MRVFFLFFLSLTIGNLGAQVTPAQEQSIDSLFSVIGKDNKPGCVIGIMKEGKLIFSKGYGSANLDYNIPLTPESAFPIGGLSRQVTASCIGLLITQGKIQLTDDIRKYIPELPDFGTEVSIRSLVLHTSGIRDYFRLMDITGADVNGYYDNDFVLKLIEQVKGLNNKPGTEFILSNSNDLILAELIRKVTGKTLPEFCRENIFVPLGMDHTFFNEDCNQVLPSRATPYKRTSTGAFEQCLVNNDAYGDHGLVTTVSDFCKWDQNYYSQQVGGESLHKLLYSPSASSNGETESYSFGNYFEKINGMKSLHLGGFGSGFKCDYYRFPDSKFSVVIFCNREDFTPARTVQLISELFLAPALFKQSALPPKEKIQSKTLESYAGTYQMNRAGITVEILFLNDTLRMKGSQSGQEHLLLAFGKHSFRRADAGQIQLLFLTDAHAKRKLEIQNDGNKALFTRIETAALNDSLLSSFAGNYFSKELKVKYRIVHQGTELIAYLPNGESGKLRAGAKDELNVQTDNLKFIRDSSGIITGFMLDSGGNLGEVKFEKN